MAFNHFDDEGRAVMVDVSEKQPTLRIARAETMVKLTAVVLAAVCDRSVAKGDVFGVARLAGISAAKKTPSLIPLAHPLAIHHVALDFAVDNQANLIRIESTVRAHERTGVEMEAMVAVSVAALTIYDMCKGQDKSITIGPARLLWKEGGKSGVYQAEK